MIIEGTWQEFKAREEALGLLAARGLLLCGRRAESVEYTFVEGLPGKTVLANFEESNKYGIFLLKDLSKDMDRIESEMDGAAKYVEEIKAWQNRCTVL